MPLTEIQKDPAALTMTVVSDWDAPAERVWALWSDPRKLERWWGPPGYPATVVEHDLRPGGRVRYYMTGPEDQQYHGWWRVLEVDAPRQLRVEDGFGDAEGNPNPEMPTTQFTVTIEPGAGGGTRMLVRSTFPSREAMDQLLAMGMEEGIAAATGQIDAILAEA
ncbi:MAG: SRPBCC domain-containing protein [Dehalococcoidia bacterium]